MKILLDPGASGCLPSGFPVLWLFSDEQPIKGLTGLLDWRLDAAFSRLVMAGTITGHWEEKVLLWGLDGCLPEGALLMGLGPMEEFGADRTREAGRLMVRTLAKLGRRAACMTLPGDGTGRFDASAVAEHFLHGLIAGAGDTDLVPTFLCGPDTVDETLLGFQKTKVSLKGRLPADIVLVK